VHLLVRSISSHSRASSSWIKRVRNTAAKSALLTSSELFALQGQWLHHPRRMQASRQ
jgi:hypothetical protein